MRKQHLLAGMTGSNAMHLTDRTHGDKHARNLRFSVCLLHSYKHFNTSQAPNGTHQATQKSSADARRFQPSAQGTQVAVESSYSVPSPQVVSTHGTVQ